MNETGQQELKYLAGFCFSFFLITLFVYNFLRMRSEKIVKKTYLEVASEGRLARGEENRVRADASSLRTSSTRHLAPILPHLTDQPELFCTSNRPTDQRRPIL